MDDYRNIHLDGARPVVARMTLKAILDKLPAAEFVRVYRWFLVPLQRIERVRNKVIQVGGMKVPLGRRYEEGFWGVFGEGEADFTFLKIFFGVSIVLLRNCGLLWWEE